MKDVGKKRKERESKVKIKVQRRREGLRKFMRDQKKVSDSLYRSRDKIMPARKMDMSQLDRTIIEDNFNKLQEMENEINTYEAEKEERKQEYFEKCMDQILEETEVVVEDNRE
jgi:hypothetical protein